ncbi:MAG: hypothetical protein HOP30_05790 [Cyclobacteriaceae bacterium]|nr:hypothetical protein [Cyclobacteriaceae bacterium]
MKILKHILPIILFVFANCGQPSTKEKLSDSTQLPVDTITSKSIDATEKEINASPTLIIADSATNALNALVMSLFNNVIADSSNYYKVEMKDYFDEYEGQDEMKKYTWYFDSEFSIAYSKYSYQNGAMFKPDVIEFIARNDSIICVLETSFINDDDVVKTAWHIQNGGVTVTQSKYSNEKIESIAADYGKSKQDSWEAHFDALKSTLVEDEQPKSGNEQVYFLSIRKPKHAELVDYKEVIIPKAVYDKLKQ